MGLAGPHWRDCWIQPCEFGAGMPDCAEPFGLQSLNGNGPSIARPARGWYPMTRASYAMPVRALSSIVPLIAPSWRSSAWRMLRQRFGEHRRTKARRVPMLLGLRGPCGARRSMTSRRPAQRPHSRGWCALRTTSSIKRGKCTRTALASMGRPRWSADAVGPSWRLIPPLMLPHSHTEASFANN